MEVEVTPWAERLRSRFTSVLSLPVEGKRRYRSRIRRGVILLRESGTGIRDALEEDNGNLGAAYFFQPFLFLSLFLWLLVQIMVGVWF